MTNGDYDEEQTSEADTRAYAEYLSDCNMKHMMRGGQIEYYVEWLPAELAQQFGISLEKVQAGEVTMYQAIQILKIIVHDDALHDAITIDGYLAGVRDFLAELSEADEIGFVCGADKEVLERLRRQ